MSLKKALLNGAEFGPGWHTKTFHRVGGDISIYVNKKLRLVVKAPSVVTYPPPSEKLVAPTIQLFDGWVLQPLCTFDDRTGAFHTILHRIGEKDRYKYDLHLWNVGRFKGRPVLFDW